MNAGAIKDFTDLDAWKESHTLVLMIYKITNNLPNKEKYGLVTQIERAVVSVTSNIAEGFGRFSYKDRIRFYYIASGSLTEVKNQLIIAKDLSYIDKKLFEGLMNQADTAHKLLRGLIRKTSELFNQVTNI